MKNVSVPTVIAIATTGVGFGAGYEFAMTQNGPVYAAVVGYVGFALAFIGLAGILYFGLREEKRRNEAAATQT